MNLKVLSRVILGAILLITLPLGWTLQGLGFDYNVESFFSSSDSNLTYYLEFRELFENDNDFILIGITSDVGVFDEAFLKEVDALTSDLNSLERITNVKSPTTLNTFIKGPLGGVLRVPVIHIDQPSRYTTDLERIYNSKSPISSLFSKDTTNILIVLKKEEFTSKSVNDTLLLAIHNLIIPYGFDGYHIAGRIQTQKYYVSTMAAELPLFAGITILLMVVFLLFSFRCGLGVFIPIIVLLVSVIWTFSALQLSGGQLDLMLTILPALLFIIGISNSIHLITKYIDEIGSGESDIQAIKTTIRETGFTIFLTSSTTALGFFSLMIIDIEPIQRFGLYSGMGVMITFLISIFLVPSFLLNIQSQHISCSYQLKQGWDRFLNSIYTFSRSHSRAIVIITTLVVAVCVWGIRELRLNNHFLDDITKESTLKKDLLYFERNFSGIRPFEMGIDLADSNSTLFQLDVLKEIESVEEYLQGAYGVGALISPLTIVKSAHQTLRGGREKYYAIPDSEEGLRNVMNWLRKNDRLRAFENLIHGHRGRITGKLNDQGSLKIAQLNSELSTYLSTNTSLATYHITGAAQLMDNSNADIALNLTKGLGIALLFTAIIIGVLFRSLRIALLSLIPNALPLVIIAGLMGWIGVDLKVATALIFPIAFGIAVDDTIHLMSRLRMELNLGLSWEDSIRNSILKTGKAMLITSLILSSGFGVFMLSEFSSTYYIGLFIGLALIFAVIADLLLLPILLSSRK